MINSEDRQKTVEIVQVAISEGARLSRCCDVLEISVRTYQRWKSGKLRDERKGADKCIPRRLNDIEKQEIIDTCCSNEFKDSNPYEIFITLLERKKYIASISSFYRVLKAADLLHHRSNKRARTKVSTPPEKVATGSNQVWTWDITWLPSLVKGHFYYSYKIIDIWDKNIVGWEIHDTESEEHARTLFQRTLSEQGYPNVHIHSDNGNPMKGTSLLALLYDLGCKNSFSRPRVSNDNPYIESFFGTMKSSFKYPGRFKSIEHAREWVASFIDFYHTKHRHSGIKYFTPKQMRTGKYKELVSERNETMLTAAAKNPCRWSKSVKQWEIEHTVYLNPSLETIAALENAA